MTPYTPQEGLKPSGLNGITDAQIADHWNLYVGYVNQTNALNKELQELRANGQQASLAYADRRRRYGFELNGMVLHEYYFGNLKANVVRNPDGAFTTAITQQWGSFETWAEDFINTGKSRGIGWAICVIDPLTGQLSNTFVQLHEEGNIAGFHPVLVMDVWEHAYMVDHKAGGRADYIKAFMSNINWAIADARMVGTAAHKSSNRVGG